MSEKMKWDDLVLNSKNIRDEELLAPYSWLLQPREYAVEVLTTLGDCFLRHTSGKVFWLNTAEGALREVAETLEIFKDKLSISLNQMTWFLPHIIEQAKAKGLAIEGKEVYAFRDHPRLGGNFTAMNLTTKDVLEYFRYTGDLHFQMKDRDDIPPGL